MTHTDDCYSEQRLHLPDEADGSFPAQYKALLTEHAALWAAYYAAHETCASQTSPPTRDQLYAQDRLWRAIVALKQRIDILLVKMISD